MKQRIAKLDDKTYIHLSSNYYQIHLIRNEKNAFRINSEEKIVFFEILHHKKKQFMEKNTTVTHFYIFVVDVKLTWSIIKIKNNNEEPLQLYTGKIVSEKYQLKKIIGVFQIGCKVIIVFSQFRVMYLDVPTEDVFGKQIMSKQFIPYGKEPDFQSHKFSVYNGYLPSEQEYEPTLCHFQTVSPEIDLLFLVYSSKNNNLSSIYTLEYHKQNSYFLSSKNILYNIEHKVRAILSTENPAFYIIQTTQNLILWNLSLKNQQQSLFQITEVKYLSNLNKISKSSEVNYIGVSNNNKIIKISWNKQTKQIQKEQIAIPNIPENISILQIYPKKQFLQFYLLNNKQEVLFLSKNQLTTIISNEHTEIKSSKLQLNFNFNFMIVDKSRGQNNEKIIFGNHLFTYDSQHYEHGFFYNMANVVKVDNNNDILAVYLTSPLIGINKLMISLKNHSQTKKQPQKISNNVFDITIDKNSKFANQETLYLGNKYQITSEQIIELPSKSTKISKMFQQSTDYVTKALVLSNQIIVLSIYQQIHVFDAKMNLKFIYCCNGEIKNIYALNEVNLIGVELFQPGLNSQSGNQLILLILQQQKGSKMKSISIPQLCNYIQLSSIINTAEFKIHLFGNIVVICSNDSLHKYQIEKITIQSFQLPMPYSPFLNYSIVPIYSLAKQKNNTDFLLIYRQENIDLEKQIDEVQVYLASFSPKYLFKKVQLQNITLNYEKILMLTSLPKDNVIFAISYNFEEGQTKAASSFSNLLLFGYKYTSICSMKFGKIQMQSLSKTSYLQHQLSKILESPKEVISLAENLKIEKPLKILSTSKKQYFLIHNSRQIYYTYCNLSKIEQISYYSLINDDFTSFRNNIGLIEINDEQFMNIFNKKMVIKDIKYINDRTIFVLYEVAIIILEIGANNSLVVKQQIKFKSNQATQVVKIEEFLQNYDEVSVYLRQSHGRIYLLKQINSIYELIFHSYMDEDVLLFSRVSNWYKRGRTYNLARQEDNQNLFDEELILKKDGQLLVKNLKKAEEAKKYIYL